MDTRERTRAARHARKTKAARERFAKWKIEMESWGCTVTVPEDITPPEQ